MMAAAVKMPLAKKLICILGDFTRSSILKDLIIQVQKEKGKFVVTSHRPIRRFHVVVVLWTLKESTKKRYAYAKLLFCS